MNYSLECLLIVSPANHLTFHRWPVMVLILICAFMMVYLTYQGCKNPWLGKRLSPLIFSSHLHQQVHPLLIQFLQLELSREFSIGVKDVQNPVKQLMDL